MAETKVPLQPTGPEFTSYGAVAAESGGGLAAKLAAEEKSLRAELLKSLGILVGFMLTGILWFRFWAGWSFSTAFYFCVVTITTVGYGDEVPVDNASKVFTIVYVVGAISLIASILSNLVEELIERQAETVTAIIQRSESATRQEDEALLAARQSLAAFGLLVIVGISFFTLSQKMSLLDAVYLTTISSSTVGYGDLHIKPTGLAEWFTGFWLLFSTVCLAKVVGDYTNAAAVARQRQVAESVLRSALSSSSDFREIDRDRDGMITKSEFLAEMLIRMGKVEMEDVERVLIRFAEMDRDGSGEIDRNEAGF